METEKKLGIEKALFSLFIVLLLLAALLISRDWPVRASIIVLVLGGAGFLLALFQLASDLKSSRGSAGAAKGISFDAPAIQSGSRWGNLEVWAWLLGFFAAIHLIGFPLTTPIFVFAYAKAYGARWWVALSLGIAAWGFLYGVFEYILHVPWPEPLLF